MISRELRDSQSQKTDKNKQNDKQTIGQCWRRQSKGNTSKPASNSSIDESHTDTNNTNLE